MVLNKISETAFFRFLSVPFSVYLSCLSVIYVVQGRDALRLI